MCCCIRGAGNVINQQRIVFGVKHSGEIFPLAMFTRSGADGVTVVGVMQAIIASDHFITCSGADHMLTGLSEGSARAFGIEGGGIVGRGVPLSSIFPEYERALADVAPGDYTTLDTSEGRPLLVSRISAPFPNGSIMHVVAWHESDAAPGPGTSAVAAAAVRLRDEVRPRSSDDAPGETDMFEEIEVAAAAAKRVIPQRTASHADADDVDPGHRRAATEAASSGRTGNSQASKAAAAGAFRKAVLDGRMAVPRSLRRLKWLGFIVVVAIAVAAVSLISIASSSLQGVVLATTLVSSGALRALATAKMMGRGVVLYAAAKGTMTVDVNNGNIVVTTRAALLQLASLVEKVRRHAWMYGCCY